MLDESATLQVTPGVLDASARVAFRLGGCAALAVAIHDWTSWPIVGVTDHHRVQNGQLIGRSAMHWAVKHPGGKLLDIDGLHEPAELIAAYSPHADERRAAIGVTTREHALDCYLETEGEPAPVDLARTFVRPVLERYVAPSRAGSLQEEQGV